MAIDMNDHHRTDWRIDDLTDRVNRRFEEMEDRGRAARTRIALALTIALYMALAYAMGRISAVNNAGVDCESEHPTTGARHS